MVSLMSSSSYSVLDQFIILSWNSIFFDLICVSSTLGGFLVIIFIHSHSVVTSNVDLDDD